MTSPTPYVLLNIRLTEEQIASLDEIAAHYGHTRTTIIRGFVSDGIAAFFASRRPTDRPTVLPEPDAAPEPAA